MQTFKGQVAIVTGGGSGIGYRIALDLATAGAALVVNDLDAERADAIVMDITSAGGQAMAVVGDSSDLSVIDSLVQVAIDRFGRLDMAIANAGITTFGEFLDYPIEDFQHLVDVNIRGTFYLAQRAARQFIIQNDANAVRLADAGNHRPGGRLLLMSSVTGVQYHPDLTAYAMSKAAIRMLARSLGAELGRHHITVNAIAPGATLTERTLEDSDYQDVWSGLTPTGKVATTHDIANAALFLLSDLASQITGQTLIVDGGWTTTSPPPD